MHRLDEVPPTPERRRRVNAGEVLIFQHPPAAWRELLRSALHLVGEVFGPVPPLAHRLAPDEFARRTRDLQRCFATDPAVREAFREMTDAFDPGLHVFRDQLFLRVLPPLASRHRRVPPLHPHRDTWGSRLMAQENWWAPVLPVSRLSTLALYPRWWDRAVENESDEWDFDTYRARRSAALAAGEPVSYPSAPRATATIAEQDAVPLLLRPGQIACFSGAQLHGSIPNRSGLTRFSFETRTISLGANGALPCEPVNVDTARRPPYLAWFRDHEGTTLAQALAL